ncbi:hypothetical protein OTU49_002185, partial [Cherax quadricarinatus]
GRSTVVSFLPPVAPPHLRDSAVLKMIQEEEPETVRTRALSPQWPPPGHAISRPQGFMGKICTGKGPGGRPVEWPPRPEQEDQDSADQVASSTTQDQVPPPVPPRPANYPQIKNAPNLTTTYPSGFKYREQIPLDNVPAKVVMSQPAFKISQPIRRRGDDKWPPKGVNQPVQEEVS